MHKVEEGGANQCYGLEVAQLAGIPKSVVASAKRKLQQLENQSVVAGTSQVDLFASNAVAPEAPLHPVVSALESITPDDLTPKQALEMLYQLKTLV